MKTEPIVVERTFSAPVDKVWKAITDKDRMKEWYFDIPAFRPEVGTEFQFEGGTEEKTYVHRCKVTNVVPGKKLTHSWRYEGYPGNSFVTFDLEPDGDGTKLKLTHADLDTFPADNPDFAAKNFQDGWNHIVGISLKEYLEKNSE